MMFKLIFLFFTYLKLTLQSTITPDKILDKGIRDLEDNISPEIPEEKKVEKIYIYHRVKFPYNQESKIPLYYGFDEERNISTNLLDFEIDLSYSNILINQKNVECRKEDNCKITDPSHKKEKYDNKEIETGEANIVLTVNRIRPGELNNDLLENSDHLKTLKTKFYNSNEMEKNILGLAPNSDIWNYWENIYHFPKKHINITFCYNEGNEFLMFDSYINTEKEVLFKTKKTDGIFNFDGFVNYNDKKNVINNQIHKICVSNKNGLTMSLKGDLFNFVKSSICNNEICVSKSDLKQTPEIDFQMKFQSFQRVQDYFSTKFYLSEFLEIGEDDKIIWKIEETKEPTCDIILQKEFLKDNFFLINNNLDDKENMYIGFKKIKPSHFSNIDFYNVSMLIMSIIAITLFIIYLVLNSTLNKIIEKEEEIMKL